MSLKIYETYLYLPGCFEIKSSVLWRARSHNKEVSVYILLFYHYFFFSLSLFCELPSLLQNTSLPRMFLTFLSSSWKIQLFSGVFRLMPVNSSNFPIQCCPPRSAAQPSSMLVTGLTEFFCKMVYIMQFLFPVGTSYWRMETMQCLAPAEDSNSQILDFSLNFCTYSVQN